MKVWTIILLIAASFGMLTIGGCETQAQNKALIGGAIGAGAGQLIGRDTKATVIGGAVGAGAGYLWGSMEDKKKEKEQAQTAAAATAPADENAVTVWITNSNGSKVPVELKKTAAGGYIGPRGETYDTLPTEEQLRKAYGF